MSAPLVPPAAPSSAASAAPPSAPCAPIAASALWLALLLAAAARCCCSRGAHLHCLSLCRRCRRRHLFALRGHPHARHARHLVIVWLRIPDRLVQRKSLRGPLGPPIHCPVRAVRSLVPLLAADVAAVDGRAYAAKRTICMRQRPSRRGPAQCHERVRQLSWAARTSGAAKLMMLLHAGGSHSRASAAASATTAAERRRGGRRVSARQP